MIHQRLTPAADWLKADSVDLALITSPAQIFYLTSFTCDPHERFLGLFLFPAADPLLVCPALEENRAREAGWEAEIVAYADGEDPCLRIEPFLEARGVGRAGRIAVEKESFPLAWAETLLSHFPGAELLAAEEALHRLRALKDDGEAETMAEAARMADVAVGIGREALAEGCTERETAALIDYEMRRRGADGMAFDTIVLFGEKTALPHGTPGERRLAPGDLVLFDLGIVHRGYCSDITRTFAYRSVSEEQVRIYETVRKALETAHTLCRPGTRIGDLDTAARRVIEAAGYGRCFTHRLGHGLGIEAHEYPSLHQHNDEVLRAGMVFTLEPGIYVPGLGGVRIEDDVIVTGDGCRMLTGFPKELQVIG